MSIQSFESKEAEARADTAADTKGALVVFVALVLMALLVVSGWTFDF